MDQETLLSIAWQIVERLEKAGKRAYLVGGCVRDRLLGRPIKDADIATGALPEEVLALFERAEPTGLAHGTVTVIVRGMPFEVTTLRSESGYSDARRPDSVRFITDIREDLARRDFTINAMAIDRSGNLIDPFGGERDLADRTLRAVGNPKERFEEDALRMLRAIRFAAEYGLTIEEGTWRAIVDLAPRINLIAVERVRMELERITEGQDPARGFRLLADSGLARHFKTPFPLERLPAAPEETIGTMRNCRDGVVRWARLFAVLGIGAKEASGLMRRLTFSRRKTEDVASLLAFDEGSTHIAGRREGGAADEWKRLVLRHGRETAERWLQLAALAPGEDDGFRAEASRRLAEMPVMSLSELAVRGRDLMEAGVASGPRLGVLLNRLLERVALGELPNDRQRLIEEAGRIGEAIPQDNPEEQR